jgi:integrase
VRGYTRGWRRIEPELGAHRLSAITVADVQALVDDLAADPALSDSTVRNTLDPLRAIYRRAVTRKRVAVNPTTGIEVPQSDNKRTRFASREEAAALIAAIREEDRALWATAFYTGLRSGELQALRWSDVDLSGGVIHVRRAWDDDEGEQEPKSKAARRRVPIIPVLLGLLRANKQRTGRSGSDLVFGRSASEHFYRSTPRSRALSDWRAANRAKAKELGRPLRDGEALEPIGLHEARHTAASLMIAAGANAKALSVVMGHESITITFDRYGHLMPGGEGEVGRLLGRYIEASS